MVNDLFKGFVFVEDVLVGEVGLFIGVGGEVVVIGEFGGVCEEIVDGDGVLGFFSDVFYVVG